METMSVLRKGPVSVFMCADLLSLFKLQVSQDLRGYICVDEVVCEGVYILHVVCMGVHVRVLEGIW